MKRVAIFGAVTLVLACGGSSQHQQIQEVPIDQGGTPQRPADLSDENDAASTVIVTSDASAPPGVGPQSLDTPSSQDAGAGGGTSVAAAPAFVQRTGGPTQKECTDVIMVLAKLMTKENHVPTPTQAELAVHPIFGQMMTECGNTTTKKQQKCAMTARTMAAWKKCME